MELMFSIMLLGCTHDLQSCEDYSRPDDLYASRAACEEVLPHALHDPKKYPMAVAECVPQTELIADVEDRIDAAFEEAVSVSVRVIPIDETASIELQMEIDS